MAIQIEFDNDYNAINPTFVLAHRYGDRLGILCPRSIVCHDTLNTYSEISFIIDKESNKHIWDKIKDFQIMWCKEWNLWFEIYVTIDETNSLVKTITAKSLGEAELSQVNIYDLEINTEQDREREDYVPTVLYNNDNHSVSLLHKILEKAPHYTIDHVDISISALQREFSFNDISIYDAMQEIAQEINCLFIIEVVNDENGDIYRKISVYDLESYCLDCGKRGEFINTCPDCGGNNISLGYGEDTNIFVSTENLAKEIQYTCNTDNVKNCFRLVGGDSTMTKAIEDCNPNGAYIWYFSDDLKASMSDSLNNKLEEYSEDFNYYQNEYEITIDADTLQAYNTVFAKYRPDEDIISDISGYSDLMLHYYNSYDLLQYLSSDMKPAKSDPVETTARIEGEALYYKLVATQIAVKDLSKCSDNSAVSAINAMVKTWLNKDFSIEFDTVSFNKNSGLWRGTYKVVNKNDTTDKYTQTPFNITIVDDKQKYIDQLIHKELYKLNSDINKVTLFESSVSTFTNQIKSYCLDVLLEIKDDAQEIINLLIEEGIATSVNWTSKSPNLYNVFYVSYRSKMSAINAEISTRKAEIATIIGTYNRKNVLIKDGLQLKFDKVRAYIKDQLNLEKYLGTALWKEFCSYRRESTYKNDKFNSDGLNNFELMGAALEFVSRANKDIYKSATLQHSITSSLNNLLVMEQFRPLKNSFKAGNWLRLKIDDEIYRLRLLEYTLDFNNLSNLSVQFSDIASTYDGLSDIQSILKSSSSMATTYDSISRQAIKGNRSNELLSNWVERGLSVTNTKIINAADEQTQTWDSHGMLFQRYNSILEDYEDTQLKIINSTVAITDDNWETVKTAIGGFYYYDTVSNELRYAYGVNAETVVGKLILGEQMRIVNASNSLSFDEDGLLIEGENAAFKVNLNDNRFISLSNGTEDIFYLDSNGLLHIKGDGAGLDLSNNNLSLTVNEHGTRLTQIGTDIAEINDDIEDLSDDLDNNYYTKSEITTDDTIIYASVTKQFANYYTKSEINLNSDSIISNVQSDYNNKFTTINQKLNSVTVTVTDGSGRSTTTLTANAVKLAWNNISQNIKFEGTYSGAQMNIYNTSNQLLMRLDTAGQHFYHKGNLVGKIGTNNWTGETNYKGLVFDLENTSKYMAWATNDDDNSSNYICKLAYLNSSRTITYKDTSGNITDRITYTPGLHFWDKTYANGNLYLDGSHRFIRFRSGGSVPKSDDGVGYNGKLAFCAGTYNSSTHSTNYTSYFEFEGRRFVAYNNASINFYSNLNMNGFSILNQSDVRLKKNLAPTQINALDLVNAVDMYQFNWVQNEEFVPIGIMAQQLQEVAPQLVGTDENGFLYIKTTDLILYLWKAVQELSTGTYPKAPFNESDYIKVKPEIVPTGASDRYTEYSEDGDYNFPPVIISDDDENDDQESGG